MQCLFLIALALDLILEIVFEFDDFHIVEVIFPEYLVLDSVLANCALQEWVRYACSLAILSPPPPHTAPAKAHESNRQLVRSVFA